MYQIPGLDISLIISNTRKSWAVSALTEALDCQHYCNFRFLDKDLVACHEVLIFWKYGPETAFLALLSLHSVSFPSSQYVLTVFLFLLNQVLLFHDQNYGIHYEYTIPVNYTAENRSEPEKQQDSLYIWTHSGWEGCSVQCGGGEAFRKLGGTCPAPADTSR